MGYVNDILIENYNSAVVWQSNERTSFTYTWSVCEHSGPVPQCSSWAAPGVTASWPFAMAVGYIRLCNEFEFS